MRRADLAKAARLVVDPPPWNPRPVDEEGIATLLEDAFAGRRPTPYQAAGWAAEGR